MFTRRVLIAVLALLTAPALAGAADQGCVACHIDEDMEDRVRLPAESFQQDVHARAGIGCTGCHGGLGDSDSFAKAHRKSAGFKAKPTASEIATLCGGCHDDEARLREMGAEDLVSGQGRRFAESVHGQASPVAGYEQPTCISCHGVHGIRSTGDEESAVHPTRVSDACARCHADLGYMRAFTSARVRVDQLIEYRTSVHGQRLAKGDTKVAVCSSCHRSHDIRRASDPSSSIHPLQVAATCGRCHSSQEYMAGYTIPTPGGGTRPFPTDQLDRYRDSVHHNALSKEGDLSAPTCNDCHGNHGATPPEVRAVATVCAQCHSRPAELFGPSRLREDLDKLGYPGCATCHGNHGIVHADDGLLVKIAEGGSDSGWIPGPERAAFAKRFVADIQRFEAEIERIEERVVRTEEYGMDLTRARLSLNQARDRLIQARVTIHAFEPGPLSELLDGTEEETGGLAQVNKAEVLVEGALEERSFRRIGLAVALGIIALLIVALVLKIRQMERSSPDPADA